MSPREEKHAAVGILRQHPEAEGPVIDFDDPAQVGDGHWLRQGPRQSEQP